MSDRDNLPPVPPLTASGFQDPVWSRWLKLLQRRVQVSIADLAVQTANGFSGTVTTSASTSASVTLSTTVSGVVKGDAGALVPAVAGTDYALPSKYGHFHDTTTQTAAAATATPITLDTTVFNSGVSIGSPTSRIVVSATGVWRFHFNLQFDNPTASTDNVTIWFRVNGTDVAYSGDVAAVVAKHGAIDGALTLGRTDLLQLNANDYVELYWTTDSGSTAITTYPVGVAPVHPAAPGVALVVQQVT